jgi:hypothetical protein
MKYASKGYLLFFFVTLAALSLMIVTPSLAQTPTLNIPEFTVKFVGQPYDVPTTYSLDPYIGENITIPGYHVTNGTIELWIKNQPFNSFNTFSLYYSVQSKGHFEDSWITRTENQFIISGDGWMVTPGIKPSDSEYTVVSYSSDYPPKSQVDFRVQTIVYNLTQIFISDHPMAPPPISEIGHFEQRPTFFKSGEWSMPQTVIIPDTNPSPSSSATSNATPIKTPTNDSISLTVSIALIVISVLLVLVVFLLFAYIKIKKKLDLTKQHN